MTSILFTGYAPVHFLCFRPIYERLVGRSDADVFVSGGLRAGDGDGFAYDGPGLYRQFGVPDERILPVGAIQSRPFDVLFSANKRIIAPRENFGALVQIFHGASLRNRGVRRESLDYDFMFLIGPYMRRKFVECGLLSENDRRGVPIGFPKTDPLAAGAIDGRLLAQYGFDGTRPVVLYAPTGEAGNSLETMGEDVIANLSACGNFDLLVKPHDHPKNGVDWFSVLSRFEDAHTRLVRDLDVVPLLILSDVLITDASSVANEYTLLDRPIVFLDVPELLRKSRESGAALDIDRGRKGGVVVERAEETADAVLESLADADRLSATRRAIAKDLFYNPGRATEAAMSWIAQHFLSSERWAS
jgi:CDP-Glycerol:Poly(glycerophosphate) glycerophosphotransferase